MNKIFKSIALDILRNRIVLFYTLLLLAISFSIFSFDENASKGLLSVTNLILLIVPLVSLVFTTIYIYNCSEFIELLACQPVKRSGIWLSLFSALSISLSFAFFIGCGLAILIYVPGKTGYMITLTGCLLTIVFVAIALSASVRIRDKARGIGKAILLWLFYAVIYDAIVLFILFQFSDYPLEKILMVVSALNPIDLTRINILLQMDASAMMGYTGAIFRQFFGTTGGLLTSFLLLAGWVIIPLGISTRYFKTKDL